MFTQARARIVFNILTVYEYVSRIHVVVSHKQLDYSRLACARRPYYRNSLPAFDVACKVVDNYFEGVNLPSWLYEERYLINFKRNFHIFERTGIFLRKKDKINFEQ